LSPAAWASPCVSGAGGLRIDARRRHAGRHWRTLKAGDVITIDGSTGRCCKGAVAMLQPELSGDFGLIMEWADAARRMKVRTNAETPPMPAPREFGAEGIGLCRTEHMFFDGDRITAMREMILPEPRAAAAPRWPSCCRCSAIDFIELFEIMAGLPVTIRLLDPPLHEFLPKTDEEIAEVAGVIGVSTLELLTQRVDELHEFNPMLGHRGCRLAISYPEIAEMQARAIFEAAVEAAKSTGAPVVPEIMVPLVGLREELDFVKARIDAVAREVIGERRRRDRVSRRHHDRAAARRHPGHEIAEVAEFFSFGTNDLTQTTFGISRDDASSFLMTYQQKGIIEQDPFVTLDIDGVGELVRIASDKGRATRPDIKLGICGEHGGDPASVKFCEQIGLDYVSCSPFRVPIARLAAAQAAIEKTRTA
jgi:pyruvate,orthophosphate dikinase